MEGGLLQIQIDSISQLPHNDTQQLTKRRVNMNKQDLKTIENARKHIAAGNADAAARVVSFLVRAALSNKKRSEFIAAAENLGITSNPEFRI